MTPAPSPGPCCPGPGDRGRDLPLPDGLPTVAIGHSAGGHLALLAASAGLVDAAVGIAPITDLARCQAEGLGEGATELFIGSPLAEKPELYAEASPFERLPLGRPQLIVHGAADVRVPVEHSRDYVARAHDRGDSIEFAEFDGTDHFQVIDPTDPSWAHVRRWINALEPAR
jgi:dipeptidyl aminopeptidase/acylaminoacyl peptidase